MTSESVAAEHARTEAVLRTYVRDGVLTGLPAKHTRRLVVLGHLAQSFEPGMRYAERVVNQMLATLSGSSGVDHAALRRYLVEAGFLARENGVYWRRDIDAD